VVGGTRNLGHDLVLALRAAGHRVVVVNRGHTPDELPRDVERRVADRTEPAALSAAFSGLAPDAVVDTTLYTGAEAAAVVRLLAGRVGRYVWLSSGQVYLVRPGLPRPFREDDYDGPVMPEPARDGPDWRDWRYGVEKRAAEDVFRAAWTAERFPVTTLRLPMVNSRRDHFRRLARYVRRLRDGGPILVPDEPGHRLRHVDGDDVVAAVLDLLASGRGAGRDYNLSQDETVTLDEFLATVAAFVGVPLRTHAVPRRRLVESGLLLACSPFSDPWMSELDNRRSRTELDLRYTPLATTLERLIRHLQAHPGSDRGDDDARAAELRFVAASA